MNVYTAFMPGSQNNCHNNRIRINNNQLRNWIWNKIPLDPPLLKGEEGMLPFVKGEAEVLPFWKGEKEEIFWRLFSQLGCHKLAETLGEIFDAIKTTGSIFKAPVIGGHT